MPLKSNILAGSLRLENAVAGGPSVTKGPPHDDPDAVRRIQKALVHFGYKMPLSFPQGPTGPADGVFGSETFNTVMAFQKREFPSFSEWDGRVGKNTLTRMDQLLPGKLAQGPSFLPPIHMSAGSSCSVTGDGAAPAPNPTLTAGPRIPVRPLRR